MSIRIRRDNNIKPIEAKYRFNIFHQICDYRHLNNYLKNHIDDINNKMDLSNLGILRKKILRKRNKQKTDLTEIGSIDYHIEESEEELKNKMDLSFLDEMFNNNDLIDLIDKLYD